jgi:AhpD family alkylhydroperoxidase
MEMSAPANATGAARDLFDAVDVRFGAVPNVFRMVGISEAALAAVVGIQAGMDRSTLPAALREQIALVVSETNGCQYCLSAHAAIGRLVGLDREAITAAPDGRD